MVMIVGQQRAACAAATHRAGARSACRARAPAQRCRRRLRHFGLDAEDRRRSHPRSESSRAGLASVVLLAQPARLEQRQGRSAALAAHRARPQVRHRRLRHPARVARVFRGKPRRTSSFSGPASVSPAPVRFQQRERDGFSKGRPPGAECLELRDRSGSACARASRGHGPATRPPHGRAPAMRGRLARQVGIVRAARHRRSTPAPLSPPFLAEAESAASCRCQLLLALEALGLQEGCHETAVGAGEVGQRHGLCPRGGADSRACT